VEIVDVVMEKDLTVRPTLPTTIITTTTIIAAVLTGLEANKFNKDRYSTSVHRISFYVNDFNLCAAMRAF